jgi:hypothetical protein
MAEKNSITFTVDRFEGGYAVLRDDRQLEINWPKKNLPREAKEGSVVILKVYTDEEEKINRQKTARDLLREILK